jgi:general secretion pathway protein D
VKARCTIAAMLVWTAAAGCLALAQEAPAPDATPPPAAPPAPEEPLGDEEAMVLNFERADIREVIHSLATALGISYTIDPRIEGQVTIRTTGRIAREDLFPLLNQILRNNGIAAVKVGDVYQILPVAEAKTRAIIPRTPQARRRVESDDAFVIEIMPVQHVSSDEMANVLQPFVTPGGDVLSYPRANLLVVTDLESNVDRMRELVRTFDSNVFRDLRTRVFKLVHGDPEELADELLGLLAPYGVSGTGTDDSGGLYIVPLLRLNSLVVVAFDEAMFAEVERWLKLLDIPPDEGAGRQTFVYNVENAKAVDLAAVLNELFGGGPSGGTGGLGGRAGAPPSGVGLFGAGGAAGGAGTGAGRFGSRRGGIGGQAGTAFGQQQAGATGALGTAGTGTSLGGGGGGRLGSTRRRAGGVGGAAGTGTAATGGGAVGVSLPGGRQVSGGPGGLPGPPPVFRQEVRIVADEVTNSLVVLATRRDYQLIVDVLRRIDVVPRQVLLEVTIAEITLTKDLSFGIAYAMSQNRLNRALPGGAADASIFQNRGAPEGRSGAEDLGGLVGTALRVPSRGAFAVISDRKHFNIFLNALQDITRVKMLSAPHIIAADNREAHILVGQSIPILTSTSQSTIATSNIVNSVQYRDTGKILTILPQVNSKGLVNMQVRQEVSAVIPNQTSFGNTGSPAFTTREAETTVVVQDGETVVIGGIIDDSIGASRSGVPYLMDIPVVGRVFRTDNDTRDRTELLILITPYVIRSRDDARAVTEDFADRVQGLQHLGDMVRARRARIARRHESAPVPDEAVPPPPPAATSAPRSTPPEMVPPEAVP